MLRKIAPAVLLLLLLMAGCLEPLDDGGGGGVDPVTSPLWVVFVQDQATPEPPGDVSSAMASEAVANYLKSHCFMRPDLNHPEYRYFAKGQQGIEGESEPIQALYKTALTDMEKAGKSPWLALANKTKKWSGPVPGDADPDGKLKLLTILEKYGGK